MSTTNQILTMQKACKHFGIRADTLRRWTDNGHVPSFRSSNKVRMFHLTGLEKFFNVNRTTSIKEKIVYARVSSYKQRDDLERQVDLLKHNYPSHTVIHDIGSGINFKRKGLQTLLERCLLREIEEVVVVAHKIDCVASDLISSDTLSKHREGESLFWMKKFINPQNKNSLKTSSPSSMFSTTDNRQMGKRRYNKKSEDKDLSDSGTEDDH